MAAIAIGLTLLFFGVANASAQEFFATAKARGGSCLTPQTACELPLAISKASPNSLDVVVAAGGIYSALNGDLGPTGQIVLKPGITVESRDRERARLVSTNPNTAVVLEGEPGAVVTHFEITSAGAAGVRFDGMRAEDLLVRSVGVDTVACDGFDLARNTPLVRDVVCINRGERGVALRLGTDLKQVALTETKLRGITARATGPGSFGILVDARGAKVGNGPEVPTYRVEARTVLAEGVAADIQVRHLGLPPTAGNGANVAFVLSNSAFVNAQSIQGATAGTITISPNNQAGNIPARATLRDDFHQAPGSPTVNAGPAPSQEDPLNNIFDIDGQSRFIDGPSDIGADELAPASDLQLLCSPDAVRVDTTSRCVAVVNSEVEPTPRGTIQFKVESNATLTPPRCVLRPVNRLTSRCVTQLTPRSAEDHILEASYAGETHEPSTATRKVVVEDARPSATTVSCERQSLAVGERMKCRATVTDTDASPVTPTGDVSFTAANIVAGARGVFLADTCRLEPVGGEADDQASCEVTVIPTGVNLGFFKNTDVVASYAGSTVHTPSNGSTTFLPTPELPQRSASTTSVSCDPSSLEQGLVTRCTVTVNPSPFVTTPQRGPVALASSGAGTLSASRCFVRPVSETASVCQFSYIPTDEGPHTLFATFEGDRSSAVSQGRVQLQATEGELPTRATTVTQVSCERTSLRATSSTPCKVTVTHDGSAPLSGIVQVGSDGFAGGDTSCQLAPAATGTGTCSFNYSPARAESGSHRVFATYLGNSQFRPSQASTQLTVESRTETTLSCDPVTLEVGDTSRCLVRVRDFGDGTTGGGEAGFGKDLRAGDLIPTGIVDFFSDQGERFSPPFCVLEPVTENEATCAVNALPEKRGTARRHVVTAAYDGDDAHDAQRRSADLTVSGAATQTTLGCNPTTTDIAAPVNCVATVVDVSPTPETPVGNFQLSTDSEGAFGTFGADSSCQLQRVDSKTARCATTYSPANRGATGVHKLTAAYESDRHEPSQGSFDLRVIGHATTATVACAPASLKAGNPTTCTVTVSDISISPINPTGVVLFSSDNPGDFGQSQCTLAGVDANTESSTCTVVYTPAKRGTGTHRITAAYGGSKLQEPTQASTDLAVSQNPTSSTLDCTPDRIDADPTTCTVTVIDTIAPPNPLGGVVAFESDRPGTFGSSPATCTLAETQLGRATCEIAYRGDGNSPGNQTISAHFRGDETHNPSDASDSVFVRRATATSVDCIVDPSEPLGSRFEPDHLARCTVTVRDTTAAPTVPSGSVKFSSSAQGVFAAADNTCLLEAADDRSATCRIAYTPRETGLHTVTGAYGSDATHSPSNGSVQIDVIDRAATTLAVNCVPSRMFLDRGATCSFTVTDTSASPTLPTGGITVRSDRNGNFSPLPGCGLLETAPNQSRCSVTYTPRELGRHLISAAYAGTDKHEPAIAAAAFEVLPTPNPTTTALQCNPAAVVTGNPVLCTVTVTDTGATQKSLQDDVVAFSVDPAGRGAFDATPPQCKLQQSRPTAVASCQISYTPNETVSGSIHEITASYAQTDTHDPSSAEFGLTVIVVGGGGGDGGTSTALNCDPTTVATGNPTLCTATVVDLGTNKTSLAGDPVDFSVEPSGRGSFDATPARCLLQQAAVNQPASCSISYTPNETRALAQHTISALYGATASHEGSADDRVITVEGREEEGGGGQHATATTLTCVPEGIGLGEAALCVARVKDTDANPSAPTGSVSLSSDRAGSFESSDCTLFPLDGDESVCVSRYTPDVVGDHLLTATYGGDAGHEAAAPATFVFRAIAERTAATTTLLCAPSRVVEGSTTDCQVTVSDLSATPVTPSGSIDLESSATGSFDPIGCQLQPLNEFSATCSTTYTPAVGELGIHELLASHGAGDANHKPSLGTAEIRVITAAEAEKNPTTTTVECDPTEVQTKTPTTCVATVTDDGTLLKPLTGRIEFQSDPAGVFSDTSCEPNGAIGTATCEVTFSPDVAGDQTIKAAFVGDDDHRSSDGETHIFAFERNENRNATATEISCDPNRVVIEAVTTCVATVTDQGDPKKPFSGRIEFRSDPAGVFSTTSCEASGEVGTAVCLVTFSPQVLGDHSIVASFVGDENHTASTGQAQIVAIEAPNPTATALVCDPATVATGTKTLCSVTVTDTASQKKTLDGDVVRFNANPGGKGAFDADPARCTLTESEIGTATCTIGYTPEETVDGSVHTITGQYLATESHLASSDDFDVTVTVGGGEGEEEGGEGGGTNPTTTSLTCDPATVATGATSACTVTVSDTAATKKTLEGDPVAFSVDPSGKGSFSANPARCLLDEDVLGEASCTINYSPDETVNNSAHKITADYAATATHDASADDFDVTVTVGGGGGGGTNPTQTDLTCDPVTVATGSPTLCTVDVTDTAAAKKTLSGDTVSFSATPVGKGGFGGVPATCNLVETTLGAASCQISYTPQETENGAIHKITADYAATATHDASADDFDVTVTVEGGEGGNTNATTTSLDCDPATVATGSKSLCTVTVTDTATVSSPLDGDKVDFTVDPTGKGAFDATPAQCTLAEGQIIGVATCTIGYTPEETVNNSIHKISADYGATQAHDASADDFDLTVTVGGGGELEGTTLVCDPDSVDTSEASTCTATVIDATGAVTAPTGRVEFSTNQTGTFGSAATCLLAPTAGDRASCDLPYTPVEVGSGTHQITAVYVGDAEHQQSLATDEVAVTLEDPVRIPTTTTLDCTPGQLPTDEDTVCLATVTDNSATPTDPTGTVDFDSSRDGAFPNPSTCDLVPGAVDGSASCELAYTPRESGTGNHRIFGTYSGDQTHRLSQGVTQIAVENEDPRRIPSRTNLACNPENVKAGVATTCIATVITRPGVQGGVPTGEVAFDSNGQGNFSAPSCQLQGGICQVTYTPTAVGSGIHAIGAIYAGSNQHRPSQGSDTVAVTADPPKQDPPKVDPPKVDPPKQPVIAPATPPNTAIKKMKPKKKKGAKRVKKTVVKYLFISDQPGSTFQCAIDKKPFKPCKSPFKLPKLKRLKKNKPHVLQVRAVNAQGLVDPTPAVLKWKK